VRLLLIIPPHASAGIGAVEQRIALQGDGLDVGGAADCSAIIDHPSVGSTRVRIERSGEHWVIVDREGRDTCEVGGIPLRARIPRLVWPLQRLRLGDVELRVEPDPGSPDDPTRDLVLRAAAAKSAAAPDRPRLRVVEGTQLGATFELAHPGPFRIGRGESCDFFLDEAEASREHVSVEAIEGADGPRVVVTDLGSASGTFLGRSRLVPHRRAVWDPARMLRAGRTVFQLEVATAAARASLLALLENLPVTPDGKVAPETPRMIALLEATGEADAPPLSISAAPMSRAPVVPVNVIAAPAPSRRAIDPLSVLVIAAVLVAGVAVAIIGVLLAS
jgi:hypothetical protein